MKLFAKILFLIPAVAFAAGVRAQTTEPVVYLYGDNQYAKVDLLRYAGGEPGKRVYVRNDLAGRYLAPAEERRVVTPEYFNRVRGGSPMLAAWNSVLYFDRAAEYTYYNNAREIAFENNLSRGLKIGLLTATIGAYAATASAAQRYRNSMQLISDGNAGRNFRETRGYYYGLSVLTVAYLAYVTVQAYRTYGFDAAGTDLKIRERTEIDSGEIVRPQKGDLSLINFNFVLMRW